MTEVSTVSPAEGSPQSIAVEHRLIRASAGAGKTYSLTTHLLRLLAVGARPESLLAATFTRKAAGEILARVLVRLAAAVLDPEAANRLAQATGLELRREGWQRVLERLVPRLHRLKVGTLDAFLLSLVTLFRFELGLGSIRGIAAATDAELDRLRAEAVQAVLEELLESGMEPLLQLLDELHDDQARRSLARDLDRIFLELHEVFHEAPMPRAWSRLESQGSVAGTEVDAAIAALEQALRGWPRSWPKVERTVRRDLEAVRLLDWQRVLGAGLGAKFASRDSQPTFRGHRLPPAIEALYRPLLEAGRRALRQRVALRTRATYRLLESFERHYTRLRRRQGLLLFDELAPLIVDRLGGLEPERLLDLYYRLDGAVEHLLLDEFQDTSRSQWHVLAPIVEEILAYGDGSRSLFVVGDPKQAIYGWRGGCAALFGVVEAALEERGSLATLDESYRSSSEVLEAVNRVFSGLADVRDLSEVRPEVERWQRGFLPHRSVATGRAAGYVELRSLASAIDDDAMRRAAALAVSELGRRLRESSIGVLVQTNREVARWLDELHALGVEASGEGGTPLAEEPAVTAILAALLLSDHPGHSDAACHLAATPLGRRLGLPVFEDELWWRPGARQERSVRLRELAGSLRRQLALRGLAPLIADWVRELTPLCDERAKRRLRELLALADRRPLAGRQRIADFVDQVAKTSLEEPSAGSVRVMTLHKAKGLEFDAVVLPDLERAFRGSGDLLVYLSRPDPLADATAVYRAADRVTRRAIPELEEAWKQERARRLWDDLSALYVGMTRPRQALYLWLGSQSSRRRSYGSILRATLGQSSPQGQALAEDCLYQHGDPSWALSVSEGIAADTVAAKTIARRVEATVHSSSRRVRSTLRPSTLRAAGPVAVGELLRPQSATAKRRGRCLHAFLAQIEWWDEGRGQPATEQLRRAARRSVAGLAPVEIEEALSEFSKWIVGEALQEALSRPTTLLPGERAELWRERSFAVTLGPHILSGVFDRVVVIARRGRPQAALLLDFKTDRVDEAEVDSHLIRYRPQVDAYRQALAKLLGILPTAVQASLFFLAPGVRVSLD